jgi:hypothetical protein
LAITIQGNWKVQISSVQPGALPQRFIITGASSGNGTYDESLTLPIQVTGNTWQIEIQAADNYDPPFNWINSSLRTTPTQIVNGEYVYFIESEDLVQDNTWNDLILKLSQPAPIPPSPPSPPPVVPTPPPPVIPNNPAPNVPPPPVIPPKPPAVLVPGKVFTKFKIDEKLPREQKIETFGIWLDYTGSVTGNMTSFFTCSLDTGSYKKSVFNAQCYTCSSKPHFDIAYGHDGGSGSRDLGGNDFYTPSNAVYGQYRGLCLDNGQKRFKIGNNEIFHFYAINVATERMGDSMDEGNLELNLHALSGSQFLTGNGNRNAHTGSNVRLGTSGKILRLIDDSTLDFSGLSQNALNGVYSDVSESMCHLSTSAGKVFYMVSGTLETGIYSSSQPHVYGISYPQLGIILLDAEKLDMSASFLTVTGSDVAGDNAMKLFTAMSGSARFTDESGDYLGFQARKVRYSYMEQFFVRVLNQDYNFTNNLTYQTGSEGDIISDFYNKPQVYITEIGLFNDQNEMLAVAKLSAPVLKSFTEEALFDIQLCW